MSIVELSSDSSTPKKPSEFDVDVDADADADADADVDVEEASPFRRKLGLALASGEARKSARVF